MVTRGFFQFIHAGTGHCRVAQRVAPGKAITFDNPDSERARSGDDQPERRPARPAEAAAAIPRGVLGRMRLRSS